jgi:hypothetical protein
MIKSRQMRWVVHVVRIGGKDKYIEGFGRNTCKERNNLEDQGIDGRITLNWILRK